MTVAIIKSSPITLKVLNNEDCNNALNSRVNEQLAFMSSWELLKGFVILNKSDGNFANLSQRVIFC